MASILIIVDVGTTQISILVVKIKKYDYGIILARNFKISHSERNSLVNVKCVRRKVKFILDWVKRLYSYEDIGVYFSVNSSLLTSLNFFDSLPLHGKQINKNILEVLLFKNIEKYEIIESKIIFANPIEYVIDGYKDINYPVGLKGNELICFFCIILFPQFYLLEFLKYVDNRYIIKGYIPTGYSVGVACISNVLVNKTIAVLELGGLTSTISIFKNKNLLFTSGVLMGGEDITKDISKIFSIDEKTSEKIKVNYTNDRIIYIGEIIRSRLEEILLSLKRRISTASILNIDQIIVTGGSSEIFCTCEMVAKIFEKRLVKIFDDNYHFLRNKISIVSIGMLKILSTRNWYKKI